MACPHIDACPMFPLFRLQSALKVWKIHFCEGTHEKCERFHRSCQSQPVPHNLLPNGEQLGGMSPK